MRIYIVGTGGVGGYFGGKLALAGNDVTFVARGDSYEAIIKNGLVINSCDGNFIVKPAQVIDSISKISSPDLIIFAVKTYDTENAAKDLDNVINEDTILITLQNGTESDLEIIKYLSKGVVYPGIAYVISSITAPGVISQTGGLKRLIFGSRSGTNDSQLKQIAKLFIESKIDTVVSSDIERDLWKKYIFINAFSGFTALCRTSIGNIREDKFTYDLYKECVRESINVALALKVRLPATIYEDTISITDDTTPSSKSSLLIDIENGRKNEVEALNGTLVRLAKSTGVNVPMNKMIYAALKHLNLE